MLARSVGQFLHCYKMLECENGPLTLLGISPPFVLSSEQAVMRFVADTPGAIGYVSLCNIHTKIDVLLWVGAGHVLDSAPDYDCHK